MRKLILLILAFLLGLFISTSFAVEVTLFDRTFTRNTGAPVVASGTFRAVSGLATVNLTNTEISSARVTINGVEVFGPSDFNQNIDNIEKKVTLTEGENSLTVLLKSGPMGAVRIQIHMPVEVKITLDEENRVSSMITPQGGTITAQGADGAKFTLTFPPGALLNTEEITLTPVTDIAGWPLANSMLAAVRMEPEGLQLTTSAKLTLELAQPPPSFLTGFFLQGSGEGFHAVTTEVQGNTATLPLTHFTIGGWGLIECVDVDLLNSVTGMTPEQTAKTQMEKLGVMMQSCNSGWSPEELDIFVRDIHRDWYLAPGGVKEALADAEADPQNYLKPAISQLHSWWTSLNAYWYPCEAYIVPLSPALPCQCFNGTPCYCSTLEDLAESAAFSIKRALSTAVDRANVACHGSVPPQEGELLMWFDLADALDKYGPPFYENSHADLFSDTLIQQKTCGVLSLEVLPSAKTIEVGESFQFVVRGRDIEGNPVPLPRQPRWFVNPLNVASLDGPGRVTGMSPGESTLEAEIYTLSGGKIVGCGECSAITVTPGVDTLEVQASIEKPPIGYPVQFTVRALDSQGNVMAIDASTITWSQIPEAGSLHPQFGLSTTLVPNQLGTVTVTASYKNGLKTASATICVRARIATIEVSPPSVALWDGDTVHLTATAKNAIGTSEFGCDFSPTFTWYSSDLNMATVDHDGNVQGVSSGGANISAIYGSVLGYSHVEVINMTGTWHSQETWENSNCPSITLETTNWVVTQTGNQLHRYSGPFSFSGVFAKPTYSWILDYPAPLGQVTMTYVHETGSVSNDGLSYAGTLSWTAMYVDGNGQWQTCSGISGVNGVRLSMP